MYIEKLSEDEGNACIALILLLMLSSNAVTAELQLSYGNLRRWRYVKTMYLICVQTEMEQLTVFKALAEHCLHQCQRAFRSLNPIFLE